MTVESLVRTQEADPIPRYPKMVEETVLEIVQSQFESEAEDHHLPNATLTAAVTSTLFALLHAGEYEDLLTG